MDLFTGIRKGVFKPATIFYALVGVLVVIACVIAIPVPRNMMLIFFLIFGTAFFLLGLALIFFTLKQKVRGWLKKFLILTGASSSGFFIFAILHNVIYGLFILLFGEEFWNFCGGDEPFFFIIAVLVCPIGFLVGVVGSIVLLIKNSKNKKGNDQFQKHQLLP